uniref:Uncharacterized protein n=1 Tax=Vespula pensylvanica TaxID=30213 RepID=A0A834PA40_VESPE|nr:hypothetical protein H0235_002443 [Vespula pensylvanica]
MWTKRKYGDEFSEGEERCREKPQIRVGILRKSKKNFREISENGFYAEIFSKAIDNPEIEKRFCSVIGTSR